MPTAALEEVAETAEQVAEDQRAVARLARAMQRKRDRGMPWSQILDEEPARDLLERLRRSRRQLSAGILSLSTSLARALSSEGQTRRQIATRLGISHQRVTTLLNGLHRSRLSDG